MTFVWSVLLFGAQNSFEYFGRCHSACGLMKACGSGCMPVCKIKILRFDHTLMIYLKYLVHIESRLLSIGRILFSILDILVLLSELGGTGLPDFIEFSST